MAEELLPSALLGNELVAVEPMAALPSLVTKLVDELLGGVPGKDVPEQVSGVVAKLKELVDGLLGGLLGEGEAPNPADAPSSPAALEILATALVRLMDVLQHSFFEQASNSFFVQTSTLPEQINSALVGIPSPTYFSFFEAEGSPTPTEEIPTPVPTPVQAPPIPSQTPPVGSSLAGSGTLGSGDAPVLLAGVLASLAILMLGGRFSWPSYALLKPLSAVRLPIERPG